MDSSNINRSRFFRGNYNRPIETLMKYLFSKCCHAPQTHPGVEGIFHAAWCVAPMAKDTYTKTFDTEHDMQQYLHEKYMLKISKLLRE